MGKYLLYTALGTLAAAGIVAGFLYLNSGAQSEAEAAVPASRPAPNMATATTNAPIKRCMNMGGAMEADNEGDWGYRIRHDDFRKLKMAGFDSVRVPIKFSAHTNPRPPYEISPAIFKRVDQIVDQAIIEGLKVIIDVHHYEELMKNPAAHEPRLEAMWNQIAYRYATAPDNLMFELINEPNDKLTIKRTDALNRRLLDIVRQHNKTRWVIIGSAGWGSLEALMKSDPPKDPKVMTTFHYYDPFEFTHQGATWVPGNYPTGIRWSGQSAERMAISRDMRTAAAWRDKTGMPILLGEFGAISKADDVSRGRWAEVVRAEAERQGIAWCYWEWATGFPAYDTTREQWIPEMRRALTGRMR